MNSTKTFYIVRHGQTEANEKLTTFQSPQTPLSDTGQTQAKFLGKRFKDISFETLLSSNFVRARQTAEAISRETGKNIEESSLFTEYAYPSVLQGKSLNDPSIEAVKRFYFANRHTDVHHSDEENFFDLARRAREATNFLINRDETTLVIVTHAGFMKALLFYMATGNIEKTVETMHRLWFFFPHGNTGITLVHYGSNPHGETQFQLKVWNDLAHLGEGP